MASTEARQKLINALVKLSKVSGSGYFGLSKSGGRRRTRKRCGSSLGVTNLKAGALSGSGLSGGRKRKPRKRGSSLGITNISASGLSGGRKRVGRPRKRIGGETSGGRKRKTTGRKTQSPWIAHCKAYMKAHNCSYAEALTRARASYKR